jgi:hypothetical protein
LTSGLQASYAGPLLFEPRSQTFSRFLDSLHSSQVSVGHTCNPSHSGGRNQEDGRSKPAWGNSLRDPLLKKPLHKKGLVEWLKV